MNWGRGVNGEGKVCGVPDFADEKKLDAKEASLQRKGKESQLLELGRLLSDEAGLGVLHMTVSREG